VIIYVILFFLIFIGLATAAFATIFGKRDMLVENAGRLLVETQSLSDSMTMSGYNEFDRTEKVAHIDGIVADSSECLPGISRKAETGIKASWALLKDSVESSPFENGHETFTLAFLEQVQDAVIGAIRKSDSESRVTVFSLLLGNALLAIAVGIALSKMKKFGDSGQSESEARRIMLDLAPMACSLRDKDFTIVDCNEAAVRLLGASGKAEIIGKRSEDLLGSQPGKESAAQQIDKARAIAEEKGQHVFDTSYEDFNGEIVPLKQTIVMVEGWERASYAVYSTDLREVLESRKQAEQAHSKFCAIMDSMPISCFFAEDIKLTYCNDECERFFGKPKEEIMRNFWSVMPETQPDGSNSVKKALKAMNTAIEKGEASMDWMFKGSREEQLPASVYIKRAPWGEGYPICGFAIDLRKIRKVDEEKRQAEIQASAAKAANEAKNHFLALMSHEIRTPMNAILGMSDLIKADNLDETQKSYLEDIKEMSASLLQIMNDILDFSKVESGMFIITPISFSLQKMMDGISASSSHAATQKGLRFSASISQDVPDCFFGDEVRIRQITANIVSNAIKYTKEGSVGLRIERFRKKGKDWLCIKVTDTGIGIKSEDFGIIFDMFRQVEDKVNPGLAGTGLGLALSRKLAGLMGGDISVESVHGVGSVFSVTLPLVEGTEEDNSEDGLGFAVSAGDAKVLVVDDNTINRKVALAFLKKHKIDADSATSGKEAVDMVSRNSYDLVFMDHMMPEMDGLEAARKIRALDGGRLKSLPIVALTANAINGASEEFKEAGMNDCLFKPLIEAQLNDALNKWLPAEKLKQETRA
jgi:signal transduction histidine kinase/PAS domain-containing protein/AmiR/NasT family two-component response regulator